MRRLNREAYFYGSYFLFAFIGLFFNFLHFFHLGRVYRYFTKKIVLLFDENIYLEREEYCPEKKQLICNVIVVLPSRGCEYFFKKGGCAMCGFNNEIKKYKFNQVHPSVIDFFVKIFIDYFSFIYNDKKDYSILSVFMAGSFFNKNELPCKSQKRILNYFLNSNFDKLFIESRVEYIFKYSSNILDYNQRIKNRSKLLEISLGLESSDDYIRNKIIKKGVTKNDFEESVKFLKKNKIIVSTYVLVGGPYMEQEEILDKSLETIKYVLSSGVDIANIEIYCVQDKTPWAQLYKKNIFKPVELWTVIEMLKLLNELNGCWRLGGFSDWPKPLAYPRSCNQCEKELIETIERLRITHDFKSLLDLKTCQCASMGGKR